MRIDIWSDVVCPFCYIGKRHLEEALTVSGEKAEVVWHSFQLDPSSTNDDPRDLALRLGEKYGRGREWGEQANAHVTKSAAAVGLDFHLEDAKSANTLDAHRVLHLAGFTPDQIDPEQDASLLAYGLGLTSVVERPTAGVDDLARVEFVAAAAGFEHWVRRHAPRCVAFLGKAAYAAMMSRQAVPWGRQAEPFGGAVAWVLPNPSGRNLAFGQDALVAAYRELRLSAEVGFNSPESSPRPR